MNKTLIATLGLVAVLGMTGCKTKSDWQAEYTATLASGEAKHAVAKKSNAIWTQSKYAKKKHNYWTGMVEEADKLAKEGKYPEAIALLKKGEKLLDLSIAQVKYEIEEGGWKKNYEKLVLGK
jgi:hypothetical protein